MGMPIFFIHNKKSDYLEYSLRQARFHNPDSEIILLGNSSNKNQFAKHYNMENYSEAASSFEAVYQHLSSNPYSFELFCFQRWFILNDFIAINRIKTDFLYLDSDVLLYCDASQVFNYLKDHKLTVCNGRSPHCIFFKNGIALDKFCKFLMSLYTQESRLNRLKQEYNHKFVKTNKPGGICDMTAFYEYKNEHQESVFDLSTITNNSAFDNNFNTSDGFGMKNGVKEINWKNDLPFGYHINSGSYIRFNALHFQGKAKAFIFTYFRGGNRYKHEFITRQILHYKFRLIRKIKDVILRFRSITRLWMGSREKYIAIKKRQAV